jgi:ABC-type siderophore export system fused ATPase/permease subunit
MMKVVGYVAVFFGGLVFCYLLLSLGVVDIVDGVPGTLEEPALSLSTYLGFISAMMTAVTAVLAAVAIGIGVVAAFTVEEIRKRVNEMVKVAEEQADAAKQEALAIVEGALSEDAINALVAKFIKGPTVAELEEGFDLEDKGNR